MGGGHFFRLPEVYVYTKIHILLIKVLIKILRNIRASSYSFYF